MAEWHEQNNGTVICVHNPIRTAYLILLVLESERIPVGSVDEVFKVVKDILRFQEVTHTAKDERNPNFPR